MHTSDWMLCVKHTAMRMDSRRVVAFTAFAMRGDKAKMRAAGCDGYLSKPINVRTFAASVRALLPP